MIVVGSENPAKVEPVQTVFATFTPTLIVRGINIASGVPDQPLGWDDTLTGARNRAHGALAEAGAIYGVGLEGGVLVNEHGGWLISIAVIVRNDALEGVACGGWLPLPPQVVTRVYAGEELGYVIDALAGETGTKTRGGAIGFLTDGRFTRREMWVSALQMALAPIIREQLYCVLRAEHETQGATRVSDRCA